MSVKRFDLCDHHVKGVLGGPCNCTKCPECHERIKPHALNAHLEKHCRGVRMQRALRKMAEEGSTLVPPPAA